MEGQGVAFIRLAPPPQERGSPPHPLQNIIKKTAAKGLLRSQKGECIFKSIPEFSVTPFINDGDNHQRIYHSGEYQEKMAVRTPHERIVIMH